MQKLLCYVNAAETLGVVRDSANAKNVTPPTLMRGVGAELHLRLFADAAGVTPVPIAQLQTMSSWAFHMDSDFDSDTPFKIVADNSKIVVAEITETIGDEYDYGEPMVYTYTDITIPLPDTNTEEMAEWLGKSESKSGLTGELIGYDADGAPQFILQIKNFSIRNMLASSGAPTVIDPEWLNEAQVRALISASAPTISANNTWIVNGVDTGISAKGQDGKDGSDGKSAYQIAVDKGFEGNESEWLESLKADGAKSEIADAGNYFAGSTIEDVLQEIGKELDGLEAALTEI